MNAALSSVDVAGSTQCWQLRELGTRRLQAGGGWGGREGSESERERERDRDRAETLPVALSKCCFVNIHILNLIERDECAICCLLVLSDSRVFLACAQAMADCILLLRGFLFVQVL
jgi:hypothetical protein